MSDAVVDHPVTAVILDKMRAFMTNDPSWLLATWGEYKPPRGHIVLADLVDMEEVVETVHLHHWVAVWRSPVLMRLPADYRPDPDPFTPAWRTRTFSQWGVYVNQSVDAGVLMQAGFPEPFPYDFVSNVATFTLLRYVERMEGDAR